MPQPPIDPNAGPKLALRGRIVTMDEHYTTLDPGALYEKEQSTSGPPAEAPDNRHRGH